jgi:hypothetical protein
MRQVIQACNLAAIAFMELALKLSLRIKVRGLKVSDRAV